MTCKVLSATGTLNQISSLRAQIDYISVSAKAANERLSRSVNAADVSPDAGLPRILPGCLWTLVASIMGLTGLHVAGFVLEFLRGCL